MRGRERERRRETKSMTQKVWPKVNSCKNLDCEDPASLRLKPRSSSKLEIVELEGNNFELERSIVS